MSVVQFGTLAQQPHSMIPQPHYILPERIQAPHYGDGVQSRSRSLHLLVAIYHLEDLRVTRHVAIVPTPDYLPFNGINVTVAVFVPL